MSDDVIVSRVALDVLREEYAYLATTHKARTGEYVATLLDSLKPRDVDAPPSEPEVDRVHRTLALGYLAGVLVSEPRVRFPELDAERTVIHFPELAIARSFVVTLTPEPLP